MNKNYLFFAILIFLVLFIIFRFFLTDYKNYKHANPIIIPNTISIDSGKKTYSGRRFFRSVDQKSGIEYTYTFWLFINPLSSGDNSIYNIFIKGINESSSTTPECYSHTTIQSPGVWLQRNGNEAKIIISTNTYHKSDCNNYDVNTCPHYCTFSNNKCNNVNLESLNIENIPISKWLHLTISVSGKRMDVYLNGELYSQKKFNGIPKQNNNDLIVGNSCKPMNGYISGLQYFNSAISMYEIDKLINKKPGTLESSLHRGLPPYLSQKYYIQ